MFMATTIDSIGLHAGPYPVGVSVTVPLQNRDRLTTALRPILAIPHAVLVGPAGWVRPLGAAGLLGSAGYVLAIVNWFSLLINNKDLKGVRDFQLYYLRWRARSVAYMGRSSRTSIHRSATVPTRSRSRSPTHRPHATA